MKIYRTLLPALSLIFTASALAQYNPDLFSGMHWREIGPFRAGRTRALAGVPDQPNVFYIGAVNGGVWKTTDAGQTWQPLFDNQPTGSIGALAVAPSDPNVIYVASGEGLMRPDLSVGNGIYKSTDAGKTWTHLGLRDGQQIPQIAIDPRDPNRLFVAVLGHPYAANEERGIYRSTDGGQSFQKVLYKNADIGGSDVQIDSNNPDVVYASLWEARQGPWENAAWSGAGGGLFKSVDGGNTWNQITGHGLPDGIIQVDIALAPSDSKRIYTSVATGQKVDIYRSDDAGANWTVTTDDPRPALRIGGGDVPVPKVDPKNPDVLYMCSTVTWRSTDAGKTWTGIRGAPGGDDYQNIWINPNNPQIILLTSDQGGIVSVNGGATWSSWYNQPTAQMFHVTLDNAFPYRACGGQQDSGSACVASRGNDGLITFNDWHPAGIEEYGYAAPDPLDPDIVFGGKVTRYDRRTGQIAEVEPKPIRNFRLVRTEPLVFSEADPHTLFFAGSTVWKTTDGGRSWTQISQDLARKTWDLPASVGKFANTPSARPTQRGVVYALGPSPLQVKRLWAGTDDGLIWNTSDGGAHWADVTPPELKPWWKVSTLDAGHFDAETAYAAINTLRLDNLRPHLFRTHNGGKTWTEIDSGIPSGTITNVIREDTKRKGLLFAGTETETYVSFDDGDHWQSLRLNMGATSVRDLQIKGDDLVAATHGRGYVILDDITPIRQIDTQTANADAFLYKPETALRIRNDMNPPTPWPPEMAFGENPPDGAVIDYYLGSKASGPLSLDILDSSGKLVRHYSSTDPAPPIDPYYPVPLYWARPPRILSSAPGAHRFLWDMHYSPLSGLPTEPDADQAVPHNTPLVTVSPWVLPGEYTVRLTARGKVLTEPLTIRMDPRVKTSPADLQAQFKLSMQMYDGIAQATATITEITALQGRSAQGTGAGTTADFYKQLDAIAGTKSSGRGDSRFGPADPNPSLATVRTQMERLHQALQNADVAPTAQLTEACATRSQALNTLVARWNTLRTQQKAANSQISLGHPRPQRVKIPTPWQDSRMSKLPVLLLASIVSSQAASLLPPDADQHLAREIFKQMVESKSGFSTGPTTPIAEAVAARLKAEGFPDSDIFVGGAIPTKANIVVRYHGTGQRKPILLLAHIDVVEAKREDWNMDPFQFIEKDGYFYGRGTSDDKAQAAVWVANLIRYKREGFHPDRDLIVALTADEEGGGPYNGVDWLLKNKRQLIDADYSLNEGGRGEMVNGKRITNDIGLAEKTYADFRLEVHNKGGHSSRPVPDNAIYHLAGALYRLSTFEFPLQLNDVTRAYFQQMAKVEKGETAADFKAVGEGSQDAMRKVAAISPGMNSMMRTTCVATQLEGGHAPNALPQLAAANVNCRILPEDTVENVLQNLKNVVADNQVVVSIKVDEGKAPASPMRADIMKAFSQVTDTMWPGVVTLPSMSTGASDGRYLREAGIPTYGIQGFFIDRDDVRAHGRDERMGVESFYEGQTFLYELVKKLASQSSAQ